MILASLTMSFFLHLSQKVLLLQIMGSSQRGALLECLPPTVEAWVRFPARTSQSWDLYIRMEITFVKSLHYQSINQSTIIQ
jgi:hypothetical protein